MCRFTSVPSHLGCVAPAPMDFFYPYVHTFSNICQVFFTENRMNYAFPYSPAQPPSLGRGARLLPFLQMNFNYIFPVFFVFLFPITILDSWLCLFLCVFPGGFGIFLSSSSIISCPAQTRLYRWSSPCRFTCQSLFIPTRWINCICRLSFVIWPMQPYVSSFQCVCLAP